MIIAKTPYGSAIGVPLAEAAACTRLMAGNYRMPDILRQLDQETKR